MRLKRIAAIFMMLLLAATQLGCPATHSVDVKYFDLTPKYVGAAVYCESSDPLLFGLSTKTCERYIIDQDGKPTLIHSDAANAPGPLQQLVGTAESSAATSTAAGLIIPKLLPSSNTNVSVTK